MRDDWYAGINERRREVQAKLWPEAPKPPLASRLLNLLGELFVVLPLAVLGMGLANMTDPSYVDHGLGEQWGGTLVALPFAWALGVILASAANDRQHPADFGQFALALYVKAPFKFAIWGLSLALLGFIMFGFSQGFAHFGHGGY